MTRVFISHSAADRMLVEEELIAFLHGVGVDTWYSSDDIMIGSDWESHIKEGLLYSDWFLVVLTPCSVQSDWVKVELDWAFEQRREKIVPLLLQPCAWKSLHLLLRSIQVLDYASDPNRAKEKLVALFADFYRAAPKVRQIEDRLSPEAVDDRNARWDQHYTALQSLDPAARFARQKMMSQRKLKRYGLEIHELKAELQQLGYFSGAIDDEFIPELAVALESFQRRNNLRHVDGFFGEFTYLTMESVTRLRKAKLLDPQKRDSVE